MSSGSTTGLVEHVVRSRPLDVSLAVGLVHAVAAVGIRIWSGEFTALWDPSMPWMLVGGFIIGAAVTYLYVGTGLNSPAVVALLFLIVGGVATRQLHTMAGEDALGYAFTPMTVYTNFWPIVLALILVVGAIEWAIRNRTRVRHPAPE